MGELGIVVQACVPSIREAGGSQIPDQPRKKGEEKVKGDSSLSDENATERKTKKKTQKEKKSQSEPYIR